MKRATGLALAALVAITVAACGFRSDVTAEEKPKMIQPADCVYVPTPNDVVEKMVDLAAIKKDDLVYDLGCGDGRMVIMAAKKSGAKGVGFEIDPQRIEEARRNVKKKKVEDLVSIEQKDIFKLDISKANVLLLYLLPDMEVKLIPQLKTMKAGSRIVVHNYPIEGMEFDKSEPVASKEDNYPHTVYLYTLPLKEKP